MRRESDITAPRTAAAQPADRPGSAPRASDRLSLFFTAERWRGEIETREPDKCAGWQWLPLAALPANIVPYARQAIADLIAGKRVGLFGWS